MSDAINQQTEKMREMAQTTLEKAKEAVTRYIEETNKLREKTVSSMRATASTSMELNEKAASYAEANVNAGFELAHRLLQAKDSQELGSIYQSHFKEQMEQMKAQYQEMSSLFGKHVEIDPTK